MKKIIVFTLIGLSLVLSACSESGEAGIEQILLSKEPPVGAVFEVASGDEEGLSWMLPLLQSYSHQLREKYPEIRLAVVFHGEEQFQLTKDGSQYFPDAHKNIKSLIKVEGMDVHVCGNYAESSGFKEDDFVDYIDVADRGPARINAYENDGCKVIFVRRK